MSCCGTLTYVCYGVLFLVALFVWDKIVKPYLVWWSNKRNGAAVFGFPIPILGNALTMKKIIGQRDDWNDEVALVYFLDTLFQKKIPRVITYSVFGATKLIINDPAIAHEVQTTYSRIFDKHYRTRNEMKAVMGESILFMHSDQRQAEKRKIAGAVFMKEQFQHVLREVVKITQQKIQNYKADIAKGEKVIDFTDMLKEHLRELINLVLFGKTTLEGTPKFVSEGKPVDVPNIGALIMRIMQVNTMRHNHPLRQIFECLDDVKIPPMAEFHANVATFRAHLKTFVAQRRAELQQNPNLQAFDFITNGLKSDLYSKSDDLIVDDCITFMLGGTQTTAATIINALYRITMHRDSTRKQVHQEIAASLKKLGASSSKDMTLEKWQDLLTYDNLSNQWEYLQCCINESLRLEPPVRIATPHTFTEDVTIGGFPFRKGQCFNISLYHMHRNPQEWIQPDDFIPERFDPNSKFYLTPGGKTRHPGSYMPFLNARRICLGKPFADLVSKAVAILFLAQLDFDFVDPNLYKKKPPMDAIKLKKYEVKLTVNNLEI